MCCVLRLNRISEGIQQDIWCKLSNYQLTCDYLEELVSGRLTVDRRAPKANRPPSALETASVYPQEMRCSITTALRLIPIWPVKSV